MNTRFFFEVFITLVVIMDPPGAIPVFLSITAPLSAPERRRTARLAVLTAFFVVMLFAIAGRQLLEYLHVSVPALQAAGGLLLLYVSFELVHGRNPEPEPSELSVGDAPSGRSTVGISPLGIPLLAGPGAIVATIVFVEQAEGPSGFLSLVLGMVAVHVLLFLALRFSEVIRRLIRDGGIVLVTGIAGVLLSAISVQMLADAIRAMVDA